jgi:hypothetical protein
VAVNDNFWLGQLLEPIFTWSLIVPVAFFAVLPLTVLVPYLVMGGVEPRGTAVELAFLTEQLPLLSTLIVPTFLTKMGFLHGSPGSAHPAAVAG